MSDWIHCNKCFIRYNRNVSMYISNCKHLLCEKCISIGVDKKCVVCSSSCQLLQIAAGMEPHVQMFFQPVTDTLEKATEISKFQFSNFIEAYKNVLTKYEHAKAEAIKGYNIIRSLKKENHQLHEALNSSNGGNQKNFFYSTPRNGSTPSIINTEISSIKREQRPSLNNSFFPRPGMARRVEVPSRSSGPGIQGRNIQMTGVHGRTALMPGDVRGRITPVSNVIPSLSQLHMGNNRRLH